MGTSNSTKLLEQQTVVEIGSRLSAIAAILAGFKPTLDHHLEDVDQSVGDSLALLGGLAEYVHSELSGLAEHLEAMGNVGG